MLVYRVQRKIQKIFKKVQNRRNLYKTMESYERVFEEIEKIESPFKASATKENEEDKWVITCGAMMALPVKFDTKEEAEKFIQTNLPKGYTLMAVSALIVNIVDIIKKIKEEEK